MKNLKISHSVYPNANRRDYTNGKPIIERKVNTIGFNLWAENMIKSAEGVCYQNGQESALIEAKKLIEVK